MVNSEDFIKRIQKILDFYSLTASSFADKIEVQRSTISHLLSGRNKPSLEFIMKIENAFPEVNLHWLINGKGSFPHEVEKTNVPTSTVQKTPEQNLAAKSNQKKIVEKVILFYNDGSFEIFDS